MNHSLLEGIHAWSLLFSPLLLLRPVLWYWSIYASSTLMPMSYHVIPSLVTAWPIPLVHPSSDWAEISFSLPFLMGQFWPLLNVIICEFSMGTCVWGMTISVGPNKFPHYPPTHYKHSSRHPRFYSSMLVSQSLDKSSPSELAAFSRRIAFSHRLSRL